MSSGSYAVQKYVPTEETKADDMVQMNTPYTKSVEEEAIDNMLPLVESSDNTELYKPVLDDNIESLNYK